MKNKFLTFILSLLLFPNLFAQCDPDTEPPVIATDSIIISCQLYNFETAPNPTVSDNCDDAPTLELIDQYIDDDNICMDDNFSDGATYITSTWEATDATGNQSTAERVTVILNTTEFTFPSDIEWTTAQVVANPNVLFPTELTDDLTTTGSGIPNLDFAYCNYAISADTDTVTTCGIGFMHLQRTWVVLNWCTNSLISEDSNGDDNVQNIVVGDPSNMAPTAVCFSGLVVELAPLDTDGDGQVDECFVELFAQDFNNNSSDDTTPAEDLIFYFNDNPEELVMSFNSSDIGPNEITIYVGDADGCVSTCTTALFLEAGHPNCMGIVDYSILGNVSTIQNEGIKDVEVNISGSILLTDANGNYDFGPIGSSGGASFSCYKNNDPSNGVTGSDLIIMRQHILTIAPIENPVYLLAADVNNNGAITTADVVAARQVILGNATSFPNNTSWRFYYGDIATGEITETIVLNISSNSDTYVDFTGYKVGDVNGDAVPE